MERILHIVQHIASAQIIIIVIVVVLFYLFSIIFKINDRLTVRKNKKIKARLKALLEEECELSSIDIKFFQSNIRELLKCIEKEDIRNAQSVKWQHVKQQLSDKVLKVKARKLALSRHWMKNYLAVLCYRYGVAPDDQPVLSKLVNNGTLLVSLNAGILILLYPSKQSVNALIDSYTAGRYLQQNLFAEVLTSEPVAMNTQECLFDEINHRLSTETNVYAKSFCYRILTKLSFCKKAVDSLYTDLSSSNIELKISATNYLALFKTKKNGLILIEMLSDDDPSIRAVAAKLLGDFGDDAAIEPLEIALRDKKWWVRVNSAASLAKLGEKGLLALRKQSPQIDLFAYEAAQKVWVQFF